MFSCSPTKYVGENEYLLDENKFKIEDDSTYKLKSSEKVTAEDLLPIVKQKPNRKVLLGIRFHLRLYSLSNQKRIDKRKVIKQAKADKKNKKIEEENKVRIAEKKEPKQYVVTKKTFGEKLRTNGEAPVILDSTKVQVSAKQISNYLFN